LIWVERAGALGEAGREKTFIHDGVKIAYLPNKSILKCKNYNFGNAFLLQII